MEKPRNRGRRAPVKVQADVAGAQAEAEPAAEAPADVDVAGDQVEAEPAAEAPAEDAGADDPAEAEPAAEAPADVDVAGDQVEAEPSIEAELAELDLVVDGDGLVTLELLTGLAGPRQSWSPKDPYRCSPGEAIRLTRVQFARPGPRN